MKKLINPTIKQATVALLLTAISSTTVAQKQPQIQEISVRAPDNVKVDGKMNEWTSPFLNATKTEGFLQAYNSSSRVYYTVANDDNNLYFVIRGLGSGVAQKFISGGLTITVSHATDRKREKAPDNVALTFPIAQDLKTTKQIMGMIATVGNYVDDDSVANRHEIESLEAITNKMVNDAMKEIRVVGIKEIPDSVVSIYNMEGIKADIKFIKRQPIVEFAIPLKYLALSIDNPVKFSYNIRSGAIQDMGQNQFPAPMVIPAAGLNANLPPPPTPGPNVGFLYNPTDFWGIYTLAKKP